MVKMKKVDLVLPMILFVLLGFSLVGSIQASSVMWNQTYEGEGQEVAHWLIVTSDGGYAIGGYTGNIGATEEDSDFWLVKTDANGNMEWNQTYDWTDSYRIKSLLSTYDGGIAIAGHTIPHDFSDFWLVKIDTNGKIEWNKTYGGEIQDRAYSLVQTSDGGYALAGSTWSFGAGKDDFWLVKTDSLGNMEWNRTYGGAESDSANSLIVTSDGGFALAGSTWSFNLSSFDYWLVKTNANGNMVWNQTYDYKSYWDVAYSVFETSEGGYAIFGTANLPVPLEGHTFWLVKTDWNGEWQWNKTYIGRGYEDINSLIKTSDGGFALAGFKNSFSGEGNDFWLIKTDGSGNIIWSQTYGGTESDVAHSLVETSDGGYAIVGETYSFGAGDSDFWLVKTDELGNIPEFPSLFILPLFVIFIIAVIIGKMMLTNSS